MLFVQLSDKHVNGLEWICKQEDACQFEMFDFTCRVWCMHLLTSLERFPWSGMSFHCSKTSFISCKDIHFETKSQWAMFWSLTVSIYLHDSMLVKTIFIFMLSQHSNKSKMMLPGTFSGRGQWPSTWYEIRLKMNDNNFCANLLALSSWLLSSAFVYFTESLKKSLQAHKHLFLPVAVLYRF